MKLLFIIISITAIVVTVISGLESVQYSLILFALSPYLMNIYLIGIAKHKTAVLTARTMTLFLVAVGLYFLLDTTYMEKHLEERFSFLFIPIWQWTMLLVSGFVIYLSNERTE